MIRRILVLAALAMACVGCVASRPADAIRVGSYNIRLSPGDRGVGTDSRAENVGEGAPSSVAMTKAPVSGSGGSATVPWTVTTDARMRAKMFID